MNPRIKRMETHKDKTLDKEHNNNKQVSLG
jgi:hypothetical protein